MDTYLKSYNLNRYWMPLFVTLLALIATTATSQANDDLQQKMNDPANWASWGGNYAGTRYSPLDQINTKNAHQLQVAWMASTGVLGGHEGGPLVIGDTIYIHTPFPNKVMAFNQADQTIKWVYESQQNEQQITPLLLGKGNGKVNSGLAYGEGMIFLNQADTTLVALNAETGKKVWSTKNGEPKIGATASSAPLVVNDKVIVGISGGDYGVRGYLTAYYLKDGSLAWRGYSMGPDKDMLIEPKKTQTWTDGKMQPVGKHSSLDSWQDQQWKIGGGSTSGWITFDPTLNLIYYGTGAPAPWNPVQRPGDNRWTSALWARDADTGQAKWVYQMTPHNEWGYSGENESVLIEQQINGKQRAILMHFDANGFAYKLDRETGELLSADKMDESVNWATHIDLKTGRPQVDDKFSPEFHGEDVNTKKICPSLYGQTNRQPTAYLPNKHLFYINKNNICMDIEPFEVEYAIGQPYMGGVLDSYRGAASLGEISFWDLKSNSIIGQITEKSSVVSGSIVTAGNIIFYGTLEGYLKVIHSNTGEELYSFKTASSIISNISTWQYQGKQYIGVLSGLGGWPAIEAQMKGYMDKHYEQMEHAYMYRGLGFTIGNDIRRYSGLSSGTFIIFQLPESK